MKRIERAVPGRGPSQRRGTEVRTCLACVQNCDQECGDNPENEGGRGQVIQGFPSYGKDLEFCFSVMVSY